jgi:hypothetical protein
MNVCGGDCGILKMAGGAGVPRLEAIVIVQEMDEGRKEKKNHQKNQVEAGCVLPDHGNDNHSRLF